MNPLERISEKRKVLEDISYSIGVILNTHKINYKPNCGDIKALSKTLLFSTELSNIIKNFIWLNISQQITVFHFTSEEKAESIINSQIFRLGSICKRFSEHEVETFCLSHGLCGWLEIDTNGEKCYKNDMKNTYYGSFADGGLTEKQQQPLWNRFAQNGGVRLTFKITPSTSTDISTDINFKKIYYESAPDKPIKILDAFQKLAEKHKLKLVLRGQSTLSAFYLPASNYEVEHEYRILIRKWDECIPVSSDANSNTWIDIPINSNTKYNLRLDLIDYHACKTPANLPNNCTYSSRLSINS